MKSIKELIIAGDEDNLSELIKKKIVEGIPNDEILDEITAGIRAVGDLYEAGELYLPDMLISAEAVKKVEPLIKKSINDDKSGRSKYLGKIVIGTVKGDVHDIGKNLVATILGASGFEVINIGVDIPAIEFVNVIKKESPDIVALSALLSVGVVEMGKVINEIINNGLREKVKVIIGGPCVDDESSKKIGADDYGLSAVDAVKIAKKVLS